jgi:hypothetical protein
MLIDVDRSPLLTMELTRFTSHPKSELLAHKKKKKNQQKKCFPFITVSSTVITIFIIIIINLVFAGPGTPTKLRTM